eukprot:CAMPEP_0206542342 /NCGR_PEP_ID=MMETSP0325_2-20121206/10110_1 /ASSEMBLY_ACC=CAM_ASM_000347 /TAXON_ID=2866 /ORGANISM="Crypthecodinium cohnii, Strain Seligo" /LENGTH=99 /DNA_ID=CAMNT_0054040371 /DNA_START=978 /DNA_END=1274 /DNA_ORIENTATION=-
MNALWTPTWPLSPGMGYSIGSLASTFSVQHQGPSQSDVQHAMNAKRSPQVAGSLAGPLVKWWGKSGWLNGEVVAGALSDETDGGVVDVMKMQREVDGST